MSEKRQTRSSTSTLPHHNHLNHHNHHNNHSSIDGSIVLVRESKSMRSSIELAGANKSSQGQRKRKLTVADAEALIDADFDARHDHHTPNNSSNTNNSSVVGSPMMLVMTPTGPIDDISSSMMPSPAPSSTPSSTTNSTTTTTRRSLANAAAAASSVSQHATRQSSRLLRNSSASSNQESSWPDAESANNSDHGGSGAPKRRLLSSSSSSTRPSTTTTPINNKIKTATIQSNGDETEQAYLKSAATTTTTATTTSNTEDNGAGKKINTRRRSSNLINQIKASMMNGRVPTHPLGLNKSHHSPPKDTSDLNSHQNHHHHHHHHHPYHHHNHHNHRSVANNIENLIDQSSSSSSSLASSSASNTLLTTSSSPPLAPTSATATTSLLSNCNNNNHHNHHNSNNHRSNRRNNNNNTNNNNSNHTSSNHHIKNAFKELNTNTTMTKRGGALATSNTKPERPRRNTAATAAAASVDNKTVGGGETTLLLKSRTTSSCDDNNTSHDQITHSTTTMTPISPTTATTTTTTTTTTTISTNVMQCPVQGCNSLGCLDGLDERHVSYDKCPVYFGMSADECKRRRCEFEKHMSELRERVKRVNEGKKILRHKKTITQEQTDYYTKLTRDLKKPAVLGTSTTSGSIKLSASQQLLPETTPELLGDIKNLSTSFIITSITNSFAPTPMPHFGAFVPPPTSLASHSLLLQPHTHHLNSSTGLSSSLGLSSSGGGGGGGDGHLGAQHLSNSMHGGNSFGASSSSNAANSSNVSFLNRLTPSSAIQPAIDDLGVSAHELDMFRDVLVTGMAESVPVPSEKPTSGDETRIKAELDHDHHRRSLTVDAAGGAKLIQLGNWEIQTWYKSPYPDDYWQLEKIFLCQFCLTYMKSHTVLSRHLEKCVWRHPPGREIYRKGTLSFFEVDGKFNKIYCQNLCLLAKLFLDHKTLYFDVEPFLFYILTHYDESSGSFQMIGYFSKEKQSIMNYNLSCILILPQFMTQGYGRLLIDFSYLLSRVEGKLGSPERPLSDLGLLSYRSYWKSKVLTHLALHLDDIEILVKDISAETGILSNDIISTLQYIGLIKYWKGKHVILKDRELIDQLQKRKYSSEHLDVDPSCLRWSPYVYQTIINESESSPLPTGLFSYQAANSATTSTTTSGRGYRQSTSSCHD